MAKPGLGCKPLPPVRFCRCSSSLTPPTPGFLGLQLCWLWDWNVPCRGDAPVTWDVEQHSWSCPPALGSRLAGPRVPPYRQSPRVDQKDLLKQIVFPVLSAGVRIVLE